VTRESGLEALQSGTELRGPVEALDGHHCNDHFAQIYESDEERFAAAVPFVRHGLDANERVMYVVEEDREDEAWSVLRDGDIDVDAALASGALSFHTAEETYLRNGDFAPGEMIEFYADMVAEATAEYDALRIVAETSWLDGDAIPYEQFMEYEAKVNQLFDVEDCLALCQYDRDEFPPEFIQHIVRSHPHLIYDGAVCHNVYYTPPAEVLDDDPARELDRMLGTLRDRTEAKVELQQHDRFLRDLYAITASQNRSFEEKLDALFDLGCERFDLDFGFLNQVDPHGDHLEIEYASGDHEHYEVGVELPLSETYCKAAVDVEAAASIANPADEGYDDLVVYEEFGVDGYFGIFIPVNGGADRTLAFVPAADAEAESVSVSEQDQMYLELMGQWVGYELNRRQRERFLRECHDITSDPTLGFEARVEHLLDLGRNWFDLDMAGLHHLPVRDGRFRLEKGVGLGIDPEDEPLITNPGDGAYCRQAITADAPVGRADVRGTDWEDDEIYDELGVTSYLGTTVTAGGTPYGTLWFGSTEPRDREFTETERTFVELMGQWVGYELNRRQRERFLRECHEITADPDLGFDAKLERLLDLGRDLTGLEAGGFTHLSEGGGKFLTEYAIGYGGDGDGGIDASDGVWTNPGEGCFCREVITADEPVGMADVRDTVWEDDRIHQEHGLSSYLGTKVTNGSTPYGTLWVGSTEPRDHKFTETEQTFLDLIGQWVSYELERRELNDAQRELYEVVADPALDTDAKLDRLLDVGCEYLDLPVGLVTCERDEAFEIEQMHGTHPDLDEGTLTPPMTDNYCRRVVDTGEPISVADAGAAGWDEDALYDEFGLECYAGVQLTVGDEPYGTICFSDLSPREAEFTEAEQTFLDLLGQCANYELERSHHEAQLEDKNDRLESFASMLAHELRNPVTIGQIYGRQLPDEADAEAIEYVTEAFDRIEDMIDVMLVLTRGREAVGERTPVSLASVARDVWDDVDAPDANLDVTLDRTIQADETYVRHLFRNLLENAVEHGGADVSVTVGDTSDGFYVADDGPGIPPDEREAVFESGYTTTADTGGTGLGLAFVQKLAEVYEWDYAVTESEAGGAQFEFHVA
jgi:signal transduction histidine kinase